MVTYRGRQCYIDLQEGPFTVKVVHTVPTDPKIADELLYMQLEKAYAQMSKLIKDNKRRLLEVQVYGRNNG